MNLSPLGVGGLTACLLVIAIALVSCSRVRPGPSSTREHARVDVGSLLSLPNVTDSEVVASPLVAVFSSSTEICSPALQEVEEFRQILGGALSVPPTSLFLLLEDDEDRAKYFFKTRDLSLPMFHADDAGVVGQLYGGQVPEASRPLGEFEFNAEGRLPMLFLIDSEEGRILGGQPIPSTPTEPGWKLAVIQRILQKWTREGT